MLSKEPNTAHLAIAECEARLRKQGRSVVVITQVIDDLHRQAGSRHVLKIHGERAGLGEGWNGLGSRDWFRQGRQICLESRYCLKRGSIVNK